MGFATIFGLVAASILLLASLRPAGATVSIEKAYVTGGQLVVEGAVTAGTRMTLDQLYSTRILGGRFRFAIAGYAPPDCTVRLTSDGAYVYCPAGFTVLSGGFEIAIVKSGDYVPEIRQSSPTSGGTG